MNTSPNVNTNASEPTVEVVGNSVVINNVTSTDPVVVRGVTESEDPVACMLDHLSPDPPRRDVKSVPTSG